MKPQTESITTFRQKDGTETPIKDMSVDELGAALQKSVELQYHALEKACRWDDVKEALFHEIAARGGMTLNGSVRNRYKQFLKNELRILNEQHAAANENGEEDKILEY